MALLHLAFEKDWNPEAETYDRSTRGMTIEQVGFLHACTDEEQMRGVVERFYADVTEPLVVLDLDEDALAAAGFEVRFEPGNPADPSSELFPHVYGGPIPTSAISRTRPLGRPGTSSDLR